MAVLVASCFAATFLLAVLGTYWVRGWARRVGFVDRPGGHKQHDTPIAQGGGIALTAAIIVPVALGSLAILGSAAYDPPQWLPEWVRPHVPGMRAKVPTVLGIAGGMLVLHFVGLCDDRKPLGPAPKLLAQLVVAVATAWLLGVRIFEFLPVRASILATVLWLVLITNAFNFLDNADGLSAGVGAIAAVIFAMAAMRAGQVFVPMMACVVAGSLAGFLVFNFAPASIFMGDAGSLVIGYVLGVVTILTTFYDPAQQLRPMGLMVPVVVLAVPLYDVGSVVYHRLRAGDSPFRGDRRHFSHRLIKRGMSTRSAVLTIYLATAATGLSAILLPRADWFSAGLILAQCVCTVVIIALLEHPRRG